MYIYNGLWKNIALKRAVLDERVAVPAAARRGTRDMHCIAGARVRGDLQETL